MLDPYILLDDVHLKIPIIAPSQRRLFRKPTFMTSVGGRLGVDGSKVYVEALKGISLDLKRGNNLALIGHNGAGKSSLLRLIAGIYPPSRGRLRTQGSIGCLLEVGAGVSEEMTGRECIKYETIIHGKPEQDWRDVEADVSQFTDLGGFLDLPIRTYSAGMRIRLSAALATAWQHDILLMDEGIGAGDRTFQEKFEQRLDAMIEKSGLLVFASHNSDMLRKYCSHGLVLVHGVVQFRGTVEAALDFYESKNGMT